MWLFIISVGPGYFFLHSLIKGGNSLIKVFSLDMVGPGFFANFMLILNISLSIRLLPLQAISVAFRRYIIADFSLHSFKPSTSAHSSLLLLPSSVQLDWARPRLRNTGNCCSCVSSWIWASSSPAAEEGEGNCWVGSEKKEENKLFVL